MSKIAIVTREEVGQEIDKGNLDCFTLSVVAKDSARIEKLSGLGNKFGNLDIFSVDESAFSEYEYVALCSNPNVLPDIDFSNEIIYPERLVNFSVTKGSLNLIDQFKENSPYLKAYAIHKTTAENCYFSADLIIVKKSELQSMMSDFLEFAGKLNNQKENKKIKSIAPLFNLYIASMSRPTIFCGEAKYQAPGILSRLLNKLGL